MTTIRNLQTVEFESSIRNQQNVDRGAEVLNLKSKIYTLYDAETKQIIIKQ
jgi:hypothetical protein